MTIGLSLIVMAGCLFCFGCGLVAGIDMGSKETLRQLEKDEF